MIESKPNGSGILETKNSRPLIRYSTVNLIKVAGSEYASISEDSQSPAKAKGEMHKAPVLYPNRVESDGTVHSDTEIGGQETWGRSTVS